MLGTHIATGVAGLALGPVAMVTVVRRRWRSTVVDAYHWLVLAVCASAVGLVAFDWSGLWWFVPIAAGSYAFALRAHLAIAGRRPGWLRAHLRGQGGSYIALWTAVLVVSVSGAPATWLLPTLVGAPVVEWLSLRVGRMPDGEAAATRNEPER